jgi:hypothetical protein
MQTHANTRALASTPQQISDIRLPGLPGAGGPLTAAGDVRAFGALIYECLARTPPPLAVLASRPTNGPPPTAAGLVFGRGGGGGVGGGGGEEELG